MKILLIAHVFALLLYGCSSLDSKDSVKEFMPGTYIRFSTQKFGTEYDTLVISLQNSSAGEYQILREWKYERVLDGQPIEPEYKRSFTSGIYDPKHKLLQEKETGDFYSFDPIQKVLFNGPIKYQKL